MVTNGISGEDFAAALEKKCEDLKEDIRKSEQILERLEQYRNAAVHLKDVDFAQETPETEDADIWFEQVPAFWHLEYGNGQVVRRDKERNVLMHRLDESDAGDDSHALPEKEACETEEDPVLPGVFAVREKNLTNRNLPGERYCRLVPAGIVSAP